MDHSILCVDDDPQTLSALHRSLHRYPCTVLVARSGQQALDILSTHKVEVILVDIMYATDVWQPTNRAGSPTLSRYDSDRAVEASR